VCTQKKSSLTKGLENYMDLWGRGGGWGGVQAKEDYKKGGVLS
jgi:hypothetical protein